MEYKLGLYEKSMPNTLTLKEKLEHARLAGFDFLEISIDESDEKQARLDMSVESRRDIVNTCYDAGIFIKTMCLSGHRKHPLGTLDKKSEKMSLEMMRKAIELASDLGIRIIQIAGYDEYYNESNEETGKKFSENLLKSVEMASKYGIILAFETMETEFMNTVEKAMKHVNQVNSPYLKVYPDIGNITNSTKVYGTSVVDDINTGKGNIVACHIKETVPGKFREIPFGTGHVNFEDCLGSMVKNGVKMYVGEFWHVDDDWKEILEFNNKFIRDVFSKLI